MANAEQMVSAVVILYVRKALATGVEFFDLEGHPLLTEHAVADVLVRERAIQRRSPNPARLH